MSQAVPIPNDEGLSAFIARFSGVPTRPTPSRANNSSACRAVALQPHADDVALSLGGTLLQVSGAIDVITTHSASIENGGAERTAEDRRFAQSISARLQTLGVAERTSADPHDRGLDPAICGAITGHSPGTLLLAPAAVSRHPDHRAVMEASLALRCGILWEDVAFWGIYALSVDDRVLFSTRMAASLECYTLVAVDISCFVDQKDALLGLYRSQSLDRWRPLRFAWTAARELDAPFAFCERMFVHDRALDEFERWISKPVRRAGTARYGTVDVRAAWVYGGEP
jgi:LmbE family N-acetylglucosaminyl deacetylase